MGKNEIRRRYEALQPLPDTGWDLTWIDRIRTYDDFWANGRATAGLLRKLQRSSASTYENDFRSLAPALHDLLLDAFPETPAEKAELDEWAGYARSI